MFIESLSSCPSCCRIIQKDGKTSNFKSIIFAPKWSLVLRDSELYVKGSIKNVNKLMHNRTLKEDLVCLLGPVIKRIEAKVLIIHGMNILKLGEHFDVVDIPELIAVKFTYGFPPDWRKLLHMWISLSTSKLTTASSWLNSLETSSSETTVSEQQSDVSLADTSLFSYHNLKKKNQTSTLQPSSNNYIKHSNSTQINSSLFKQASNFKEKVFVTQKGSSGNTGSKPPEDGQNSSCELNWSKNQGSVSRNNRKRSSTEPDCELLVNSAPHSREQKIVSKRVHRVQNSLIPVPAYEPMLRATMSVNIQKKYLGSESSDESTLSTFCEALELKHQHTTRHEHSVPDVTSGNKNGGMNLRCTQNEKVSKSLESNGICPAHKPSLLPKLMDNSKAEMVASLISKNQGRGENDLLQKQSVSKLQANNKKQIFVSGKDRESPSEENGVLDATFVVPQTKILNIVSKRKHKTQKSSLPRRVGDTEAIRVITKDSHGKQSGNHENVLHSSKNISESTLTNVSVPAQVDQRGVTVSSDRQENYLGSSNCDSGKSEPAIKISSKNSPFSQKNKCQNYIPNDSADEQRIQKKPSDQNVATKQKFLSNGSKKGDDDLPNCWEQRKSSQTNPQCGSSDLRYHDSSSFGVQEEQLFNSCHFRRGHKVRSPVRTGVPIARVATSTPITSEPVIPILRDAFEDLSEIGTPGIKKKGFDGKIRKKKTLEMKFNHSSNQKHSSTGRRRVRMEKPILKLERWRPILSLDRKLKLQGFIIIQNDTLTSQMLTTNAVSDWRGERLVKTVDGRMYELVGEIYDPQKAVPESIKEQVCNNESFSWKKLEEVLLKKEESKLDDMARWVHLAPPPIPEHVVQTRRGRVSKPPTPFWLNKSDWTQEYSLFA